MTEQRRLWNIFQTGRYCSLVAILLSVLVTAHEASIFGLVMIVVNSVGFTFFWAPGKAATP